MTDMLTIRLGRTRLIPCLALACSLATGGCTVQPPPPGARQPAETSPRSGQAPLTIVLEPAQRGAPPETVLVLADGTIDSDGAIGRVEGDRVTDQQGRIVVDVAPDGTIQSSRATVTSITPQGEMVGRGLTTSVQPDGRINVASRYGGAVVGHVDGFRPDQRRKVLLVLASLSALKDRK